MIKINLYQRKAAVGVSAGAATAGLSATIDKIKNEGLPALIAELKASAILVVIYGVILIVGIWFSSERKAKFIAEVDAEIALIDSKLNLLASELNKTSGYEQTKKNLEQDEKTIRTKINTIQELIRDRSTPPKILMALSEATPKDVWLKSFTLEDKKFSIVGSSLGMDIVSDFMKGLEETIYFKNVILKTSKSDIGQKAGRSVAQFELEGERR